MKLLTAVLAFSAALALVSAACPNQCSGHGRCSESDKCECFKQTGTTWRQRVGWTGADCSLRTCPLGVAYDTISTKTGHEISDIRYDPGRGENGDVNTFKTLGASALSVFVSEFVPKESKRIQIRMIVAAADIFYQWKYDTDAAYGQQYPVLIAAGPTETCTAAAPCELVKAGVETGVYVVFDATNTQVANIDWGNTYTFDVDYQEGKPYYAGSSNSAHQEVECSGRGSCDRSSGRCQCFPGYNGEACQRTVCPNDCSGHGVCQDQRRFAADVPGASYDAAYDARKQMGCMCDDGFRGPDCSQVECPSGADPMGGFGGDGKNADGTNGVALDCSGRGLCDYSNGLCQCFKGFFGERCEYQTNFV